MMKYAKLVNGVLEFAPTNKGSIINYNLDEDLMRQDGYKPFEKAEVPDTERHHEFSYEETADCIKEIVHYLETEEEYEERKKQIERERISMLSLTKREVFLALYRDKGITPEQLRSQIQDIEAQIEFDYANEYFRGNPLIDKIGIMLGYSMEDLDYLFENKELPIKEKPKESEEL